MTLQSTPIFLLTILSSLIIAIRGNKIKHINLYFFIIGGIACFVDFLTVPIISLGLPLTIYFLRLQKVRKIEYKEVLKIIFLASISWGVSYVTIWFTKWLLMDIIYNRDLIKTALKQSSYRSSKEACSYLETIGRNLGGIKSIIIPWLIFAITRIRYKFYKI